MNKYSFFWNQDGILKDSNRRTAEDFLNEFRESEIKPIFPYAVSSVERNMFLTHLKEAIEITDADDKEWLLNKANKCLQMTPYTNWSGD